MYNVEEPDTASVTIAFHAKRCQKMEFKTSGVDIELLSGIHGRSVSRNSVRVLGGLLYWGAIGSL